MRIARRFLLPKQLKYNGLDASHITITEPALLRQGCETSNGPLVVVRFKAVEWAEQLDTLASQEGGTPAPAMLF